MKIKSISAHEILASGGYPSVECIVELEDGSIGIASVPYGASAGTHEASVLNDEDPNRYGGKGMLKAVDNIKSIIAPELLGKDAKDQQDIDTLMIEIDGTEDKSKLGGNAILAVSLSVAKAEANSRKLELFEHITELFGTNINADKLPNPMVVAIEGGKHADNTTDLQEFCITGISENGPTENIRYALESYHSLKTILKKNNLSTNVGNEGAFAPNGIANNESPLMYIMEAIKVAGYTPGKDLGISIDAAASEFYKDGNYHLSIEDRVLNADELSQYYEKWLSTYPIVTVEDMHDEDDWDSWAKFNTICKNHRVELIGDDLTVTNVKRLQKAIDMDAISAILIKLNQIGTLTETVNTCLLAKQHGMDSVPSHRGGGETNDTSMVDLAVAVGAKFIKVGPTRGERIAKYNRLMEIERQLRDKR